MPGIRSGRGGGGARGNDRGVRGKKGGAFVGGAEAVPARALAGVAGAARVLVRGFTGDQRTRQAFTIRMAQEVFGESARRVGRDCPKTSISEHFVAHLIAHLNRIRLLSTKCGIKCAIKSRGKASQGPALALADPYLRLRGSTSV